jgi:hypothetical protein
MPKNADFAAFMKRKLRDEEDEGSGHSADCDLLNRGVSEDTHLKLRKLFLDALVLENDLEK